MFALQGTSHFPFLSAEVKTVVRVGLVASAAVAAFFTGGGILNYFHFLPTDLAWTNLGVYGTGFAALTSVVCGTLGISLLTRKKQYPIITGSIFVMEPEKSCALGNRPEDVDFFSPKTSEIERVDGKGWKDKPNEVLVKCMVLGLEVENQIKNRDFFFLPFSFFTRNDDYQQIKNDGEFVEFVYKKTIYKLKIVQEQFLGGKPFIDIIPEIETGYKANLGKTCPNTPNSEIDTTSYECPIQTNRLTQKQQDWIEWKEYETKNLNGPRQTILASCLIEGYELELPGIDLNQVTYFIKDHIFALIDRTRSIPRVFILRSPTLTKPMIEKAISEKELKDGVLFLPFFKD